MRDIRDMHTHFPVAVGEFFQRKGVIEILGVDRVYRTGKDIGEVTPFGILFPGNDLLDLFGFLFCLFLKAQGEIVIGED